MQYFFVFVLVLSTVLFSSAADEPLWMRYPSISPDGKTICFTYKGDLYVIPSAGGQAKQLTFHEAHDYMPVWSSDGRQIAFASDRYGNFDVFVMDAEGGAARRLTYHSGNEYPYSFTKDNSSIVFGGQRQDTPEHRQYPTGSQPELYQVPITGGLVKQIMTIPAEYVHFSKDGKQMLYHDKKGGENEFRKHHTSSITRDIWLYDTESKQHRQLTNFAGEDRHPVFAPDGQSFYYLSERSGVFNVHKASLNAPNQDKALTNWNTHPVRSLSISNEGLLCFSQDGSIYTLVDGQSPNKVDVTIKTQEVSNVDQYIKINGGVREMSISPDGKEIAFIARGEVFVTAVDGSMTKRITKTPAQEKFVSFGPNGESVIYAREQDGKWGIFQTKRVREDEKFFFVSTLLKEEPLVVNEHENYMPELSPDGKLLAYIENRKTLKVMDLSSKQVQILMTSDQLFHMSDGDQYFTWSPDSKWLIAMYRPTMANGDLVLLDASGKTPMQPLVQSGYEEYAAKWVNGGKQVLYLSNRDGLKSFATSGGSQSDVYSIFLTKETWDDFNLSKEEKDLKKSLEKNDKKEDKKEKDEKEKEKIEQVMIDWEDIELRKARLTIHSSSLSDAVLSKDGEKLYYLARFEKGINLWSTELRTKETKMEIALDARSGSLQWDRKQENLFLLSDGTISKIDIDKSKKTAVKIAGEMDLDKVAERNHLFEHVWVRTKGIFYTPDMHGINWNEMRVAYEKHLDHIGNSYEFAELLSELLGELNVSHAGARYSRSVEMADETASLGIFMDYNHTGNGIRIAEILPGGPLDKSGLNIKKGDIITEINGVPLLPDVDVYKHLNRLSGQYTALSILSSGSKQARVVTVKPISLREEGQMLYRRWVKINQAEVDSLSNGMLGYVHIPGMSDGPYRSTFEDMMGKYHDRKGMIVDTRFNGGGDLVADLAMFFTGERFLTYATAEREVGYEPTFRWTKPTLALFNEANYSDGHCFACGYTDLKIGKTVGMPVPGTCSFAGWEGLSDGTRWGVVPISAKNKAGQWLENNETMPQFKVKNQPGKIDKGIDEQLIKAIEELLIDVK